MRTGEEVARNREMLLSHRPQAADEWSTQVTSIGGTANAVAVHRVAATDDRQGVLTGRQKAVA